VHYAIRCIALVLSLIGCQRREIRVDPTDFYSPTVRTQEASRTLMVDVAIERRDGKQSFVRLFELYGFSGNGPSIEQVIRRNVGAIQGRYESEGDMFAFTAETGQDFIEMSKQLECLREIPCLQSWLENSRSVIMKE
jgi:hypothetical protein